MRDPWPAAFSPDVDPAEYVFRIGNLTLLTARVNRDVADKSFAEKKQIALDSSELPINEFFRDLTNWSEREIEQRQDSLAKTALECWRL